MDTIQDIYYGKVQLNKHLKIIKQVEVDNKIHEKGILLIAQSLEPDLEQRKNFMQVLLNLSKYFTGKALNPNKGIWISGTVGTGKTLLFEIFKRYTSEISRTNSFKELIYTELLAEYGMNKYEVIGKHRNSPVLIDDLGTGQIEINHYGNDVNFVDVLIDYRYRALKKHKKITHISTNLYPKQFQDLVDVRTYSRMQEMFNLIELKGKDFRTEK